MQDQSDFERDILDFLSRQQSLNKEDQKELLMNIFKKHVLMNQSELIMSASDLQEIISVAKDLFTKVSLPLTVRDKQIPIDNVSHFCLVESTVSFLNRSQALRRLAKFDRR